MQPSSGGLELQIDPSQLLERVIASAPLVLFSTDARGVVTMARGRMLEQLAPGHGLSIGCSLLDPHNSMAVLADGVRRGLAGETLTAVIDVGSFRCETSFLPLAAGDGAVTGLLGIGTDVTERERLASALRH